MISKKTIGSVLLVVLVALATPNISYANSYSNEDMSQVTVSVEESIIKHFNDLGLDIQSEEVKDKIKDKKVIIDNRNNKEIIEQSYIEPVVIYQEEFTISGYQINEQNKFDDTISAITSATSYTWNNETKSSTATLSYKGTYVTLSVSLTGKFCYDAPGLDSNDALVEFQNFNVYWSTTNGLDSGDPEFYINDYDGAYVNRYDYKIIQAAFPYDGQDGSFTATGSHEFYWWETTSAGYTYTITPRGYSWIKGNAGLLSAYADYTVYFYGGTSSDLQIQNKFLNVGWGELIIPE